MTWLVENPLPSVAVGIVALAILAGAVVQTGRRIFVYWMVVVVLLVAAIWVVERLVVTEVEEVQAALYGVAEALERNDHETVLQHISTTSPQLRQQARRRLASVVVHNAEVKRNLEVVVQPNRSPPLAEARFNAAAVVSDKQGVMTKQTIARYFVVQLLKEQGRWRVRRYEDFDPVKRE